MAKEPNENLDEEKDLEEAEGEEAEETSTDGEEDDGEGDDTGADDEGEDGDGEDSDDDGGEFVLPEKFKGKTLEDVAKSYVELEKSIEKKAAKRARELSGQGKRSEAPKPKDGETPEWVKDALKGVDFTKMKPEDFAAFMLNTIERRAQEIARNTYEAADSTKAQVQRDIESVTKSWPQLKENEGFRDMVLTLIENAATKGEIMPLKEACAKVGKYMGLKPGTKPAAAADEGKDGKEGEGKKKPRTGVERGTGAGGEGKESDEEKVLAGLMAGKTPGGLGGLV